jgi:hypothetical protein
MPLSLRLEQFRALESSVERFAGGMNRPKRRRSYGEDPYHIQTIGVTAMRGLQNPQPVCPKAVGAPSV